VKGKTMATFTSKDGKLFIEDREILKGFESFSGWYWFATEISGTQDSVIDGKTYPGDVIYFGYVQGHYDEWGYFSKTELDLLHPMVWEIRPHDLPHAGRRA